MINFFGGFKKEGLSAGMRGDMKAHIKRTLDIELNNVVNAKSNNISGNLADALRPALAGLMAGSLEGAKNPNKSVRKVHIEQLVEFGEALKEFLTERSEQVSGSSTEELQTLAADLETLRAHVEDEQTDEILTKIYGFARQTE